ncbi:molybdopterin-dependent oxidoreductase [Paenibacillus sp. UNC451MF]|uniref:molybdopterin-dependent oxidoreductase n=1 Tax=Paenibacillus sp. UNC451MF TaxID=1449063 RepID=UPI00048FA940|nr:molybdopterin-dependent oxidoreductase [Paenibacillus sp. UNC451MF]
MDAWRSWLKESFGKKLKRLHAWNAWLVALLALTGVVLYIPTIRGDLGAFRVFLKQAHSVLGIVSILIILYYIRYIPKHWRQIRQKINQRWNLVIVLMLLAGWSVTGLILWQFRSFPPIWSNAALVLHDLFTWVGIPYAVYHSVSRSRWLKAMRRREREASSQSEKHEGVSAKAVASEDSEILPQAQIDYWKKAPISRAAFIRWVIGLAIVFGVGPAFYRWLKTVTDTGGAELDQLAGEDANRMLPAPEALPESNPPVGGGGQGQFRIYTVTDIPAFSSENWKFTVGGLVEKPLSWSWEEFLKLKRKVQVSDFHCVTGWSVYKVTWEGIPLSELLAMADVKNTGRFVKMYSGDKVYTDCLSLEQAQMEDIMVAVLMDGKPIPQQLGGPVRLVVPQMYAYKSVKWLQAIELIDKEHIGYWEVRGYDNDAWVSKNRLS